MLREIKYKQAAQLKMDVWLPRAEFANIKPLQLRMHAQCLILLYSQPSAAEIDFSLDEQKILNGMISVLELPAPQIMTAIVSSPWPEPPALTLQIQQWQAKYILQLDMQVPMLNSANCVQTYSPGYLLANPQFKSAAYKTLLTLRAMLHGPSKRNS